MSFNQLNDDKKQTYNKHYLYNNKFGWDIQANKHGKFD